MAEEKGFLDCYAIAQDATLPAPENDLVAMRRYRLARLREQMQKADVPLCVLTKSVSMRYATDFRNYQLFQSRIPIAYLFRAGCAFASNPMSASPVDMRAKARTKGTGDGQRAGASLGLPLRKGVA